MIQDVAAIKGRRKAASRSVPPSPSQQLVFPYPSLFNNYYYPPPSSTTSSKPLHLLKNLKPPHTTSNAYTHTLRQLKNQQNPQLNNQYYPHSRINSIPLSTTNTLAVQQHQKRVSPNLVMAQVGVKISPLQISIYIVSLHAILGMQQLIPHTDLTIRNNLY